MKNRALTAAVVIAGLAAVAQAETVLTETFDNPLGEWTQRWFYQNSNAENYYTAARGEDSNYRGNNPVGLWIATGQGAGNADTFGDEMTLTFSGDLARQIKRFSVGVEVWGTMSLEAYDRDGASLGAASFGGGSHEFDHSDVYSVESVNGVSRLVFTTTSNNIVQGWVSIDDVSVTVPSPAGAGLLALTGLVTSRRRRQG